MQSTRRTSFKSRHLDILSRERNVLSVCPVVPSNTKCPVICPVPRPENGGNPPILHRPDIPDIDRTFRKMSGVLDLTGHDRTFSKCPVFTLKCPLMSAVWVTSTPPLHVTFGGRADPAPCPAWKVAKWAEVLRLSATAVLPAITRDVQQGLQAAVVPVVSTRTSLMCVHTHIGPHRKNYRNYSRCRQSQGFSQF
jgi:hypothetical protein